MSTVAGTPTMSPSKTETNARSGTAGPSLSSARMRYSVVKIPEPLTVILTLTEFLILYSWHLWNAPLFSSSWKGEPAPASFLCGVSAALFPSLLPRGIL